MAPPAGAAAPRPVGRIAAKRAPITVSAAIGMQEGVEREFSPPETVLELMNAFQKIALVGRR
jgi:hypothetical protein